MRQDAVDAQSSWERYHNDMARRHRRFGIAIVLTAVLLLVIGVGVSR